MRFFSSPSHWFQKKLQPPPWIFLIPFVAANSLLSYWKWTLSVQLWIGTLGILLPLGVGFWKAHEERKARAPASRTAPSFFSSPAGEISPSPWFWALFLFLLGWTHFYRLTSVPYWPIGDEGTFSTMALGLQGHWSWKLLLGENQWEPLFTWMLSWFFRVVPTSLAALRLFPDLLALSAVFCAYWAFRPFGRGMAFAAAWATAFNFWSFTYSRWCVREGLLLPWEFMAFGLAVRIGKQDKRFYTWTALFVAVLGSGFYVFTTWVQVAILAAAVLFAELRRNNPGREKILFLGLAALLAAFLASPMLEARLADGGMSHLRDVFDLSSILLQAARYGASLFWYGFQSAPWGPSWGGFFNPVLGALFFLGVLQAARRASPFWMAFLFLSFFFLLAPPAMTGSFSPYRVTALLPLCIVFLVWGWAGLLEGLPPRRAKAVFLLVWLPSFALDFHHYAGSYSKTAGTREYAQAYRILETQSEKTGPLYVFSDFNTDYDDKTLETACYPFDALHHPRPGSTPARWVALLMDVHYAPYLAQRFPGLVWDKLQADPADRNPPKPYGLFLVPASQIPDPLLDQWRKADGLYRGIDLAVKDKSRSELWAGPITSAGSLPGISRGDRLLTALYWEKVGFFKFLDGYFLQATDAYRKAIREGVPAAHLYYDLGVCLKIQNKTAEAGENFAKAAALAGGKD